MLFLKPLNYEHNKNDNNQIDGIDEVFGNLSESGFQEIKLLIDVSNNTIYRRRERA